MTWSQSRTGRKTTPGYPDAENVIAISADKGYKTTRKPNQSPTVMNNIISKSSVCPYILEGCIVDLWNCYIGQKLTEKEDLAVFAWRDGSFQTIPTIQQRGWQNFCYIWGKGMNLSTTWDWIQLKILCTTCPKAQSRFSCHQQQWTRKLTDQAKLYISFDFSVILKKDLPNRMRYYVTY